MGKKRTRLHLGYVSYDVRIIIVFNYYASQNI